MTNQALPGCGPDGSNLLGFLCAIGAFAALSRAKPESDLKISWRSENGWRVCIWVDGQLFSDAHCEALFTELQSDRSCGRFLIERTEPIKGSASRKKVGHYTNLNDIDVADFRVLAASAVRKATVKQRCLVDWVAALGCDWPNRDQTIRDTAFRTLNGTGNQYFFSTMLQLSGRAGARRGTSSAQLLNALLAPWKYEEAKGGMRWDTAEDRHHSLRRLNPVNTKWPIRTERGANRLAIEALPLFPTAPAQDGLQTCGFREKDGRYFVSWPVWTCPLSMDALKTLLTTSEISREEPRHEILEPLGVEEVFRSERILKGRQRNFSVAVPILR